MIDRTTIFTYPDVTEEEKEAMQELAKQLDAMADRALASDRQVGGDHYKSKSIQPWTAMESWMTHAEVCGFLRGNALKYLARDKGQNVEDLRKAKHYIEKLLETMAED